MIILAVEFRRKIKRFLIVPFIAVLHAGIDVPDKAILRIYIRFFIRATASRNEHHPAIVIHAHAVVVTFAAIFIIVLPAQSVLSRISIQEKSCQLSFAFK